MRLAETLYANEFYGNLNTHESIVRRCIKYLEYHQDEISMLDEALEYNRNMCFEGEILERKDIIRIRDEVR